MPSAARSGIRANRMPARPIYGLQMRTLIAGVARALARGRLPLPLRATAQLTWPPQTKPSEAVSGWMRSREQFYQTLAVPNTGMAVTIDIGDANEHPSQEQAGSGPAAGPMGAEQDLRQRRRGQRPALQVDARPGRQDRLSSSTTSTAGWPSATATSSKALPSPETTRSSSGPTPRSSATRWWFPARRSSRRPRSATPGRTIPTAIW